MDRWDPIHLTSTYRPVLETQETIQTTQDQVGLYDGRDKAEDYPNGTVYLTNYRILYIDAKNPTRKSIGLSLRYINGIQHYGGFMSSSPKVILDLYPRDSIDTSLANAGSKDGSSASNISTGGGTNGLERSLGSVSLRSEPSWVCDICYNSNQGGVEKCAICGVKRTPKFLDDSRSVPAPNPYAITNTAPYPMVNSVTPKPPVLEGSMDPMARTRLPPTPPPQSTPPPAPTDQPGLACSVCTFINDPFMIQCEMCGSELQDADSAAFMLQRQQEHQRKISQLPPLINSGSPSNQEAESGANPATTKSSDRGGIFSTLTSTVTGSSRKNASDANTVKLSFRNGGSSGFQGHLKTAMVNRAWEAKPKPQSPTPARTQSSGTLGDATSPTPVAKVGGISGIIRTVETHQKETDQALTQAFQDLQGLMEMAAQMVTMTESISKRLSRSDSLNNEETATFRNYLLNMGIAAPVTKDTAGAVFHKELARELVEFALPIIEREGGTMSLVDIYCVFNRARGVELISPKDLNTACQMFEELNLPLRLRKFDSGLLVIQTLARYSDDEVAQSILGKIQSLPMGAPGLSAVELASAVQISVALATEQLLTTEALGMICRDESVEGLRFFDNLMARYELPLDGDL